MNKAFLLVLVLFSSSISNAQSDLRINPFIKGSIEMLNGEIKDGWVKLNASAFNVRFKESDTLNKSIQVNEDSIKSISRIEKNNEVRTFYYKKTDRNKFNKFVELIKTGNFNLYFYTEDLSLFYSGVDRSTIGDWLGSMRTHSPSVNNNSINQTTSSLHLDFEFIRNQMMKAKNIKVLFQNNNEEKLFFITSQKKLKTFAGKYFTECPKLVKQISNNYYKKRDFFKILYDYDNCLNTNKETFKIKE